MKQAKQLAPQGSIDCHAHVFTRTLPRIASARYVPHRDAPHGEYLALLDAHAIAAAILIQPSFLGTDHTHLLDVLDTARGRLRGIAVVGREATPDALDLLQARGIVGIRVNLIGARQVALDSFAAPRLLAELGRRGWLLEVQAEGIHWPRLMPELIRSGIRIVIDHFGRPSFGRGVRCPGFQTILKAGRDLDLQVKLSAPYRFGAAHAAACADALLDALGPDRLVWGSDWPWTQHPEITDYGATLAALAAWVPDPALHRRILVDNPRLLYGFR